MNTDLNAALQSYFGYSSFRPGQIEAIQSLLNGNDTLVVMPTGAGKSLIFQFAALHRTGVTLVISPLIALMKDQVDSLERHGIPSAYINSTLSGAEQNRKLKALASGDFRLVYIAPERLRSVAFLDALHQQPVGLLAVDEAHCISAWGHDFRPDYLHIEKFRSQLANPLTAALTATATPKVQDDIGHLLGLKKVKRIITGFNRPNLTFEVQPAANPEMRLKALQTLLLPNTKGAAIIYAGTRREAEEIADFVRDGLKIQARHYHAGLSIEERSLIQDAFMAGDLPVVAATNAFGMGIDRPDVRLVIHYSLPGSLEAYYQEAGRAGRDGLPARAVLLYAPEDRALQEWFIENSVITADDLRSLYNALRQSDDDKRLITTNEICCLTGLPEVKVNIGLAELERAGMLQHLGDEGLRMRYHLRNWAPQEIPVITQRLIQHQASRKAQLDKMVAYAESNACRRNLILQHFGDRGPVEAANCCDNCLARRPASALPRPIGALNEAERTGLMILETVRRLPREVGREKIAQILKGSKAKDILQYGYNKNRNYGSLAVFSMNEIEMLIDQLLELKCLKVIGGQYPVLRLTPQGEAAILNKAAVPLQLPRRVSREAAERKKAESRAGGTVEYTAQLLAQGLSVQQAAKQRGLTPTTIYSHAAQLIAEGRISVHAIVPEGVVKVIVTAICEVGSADRLAPIKTLLPDEIDYNTIRCVVEHWKRERSQPEDLVKAFLAQTHPRSLPGPWEAGWALGFHSQFSGADWKRSGTGELTYRLKYQNDQTVLPALVAQTVALIADHPELTGVDAIIPVPPSTPRQSDPVSSFANALAQSIGLCVLPVLVKSRETRPQKEMRTLAQKRANVAGAFDLKSPVKGTRLLIIDDLFDSGATLEEIHSLLVRAGAVKVCVLTLTRTIHSSA